MDASRLRRSSLFDGLSEADLERCARWFDEAALTAGSRLVNEGDLTFRFFVVLDGELEVRHDFEPVRRLGPGDFVGELGLLGDSRRTAKVITLTRCTIAKMAPWDFRAMLEAFPAIADRVNAVAAQRRHDDDERAGGP